MNEHRHSTDQEERNEYEYRNELVGVEDEAEIANHRAEFSGGGSSSSSSGGGIYIAPPTWPTVSSRHPYHPVTGGGGGVGHSPFHTNESHYYPTHGGTNQFAPVLNPQLQFDLNTYWSHHNVGGGGHSPYHNRFPRRGIGPPLSRPHPNALRQDLFHPAPAYVDSLYLSAFHPPPHGLTSHVGHEVPPLFTQQKPIIGIPVTTSQVVETDLTGASGPTSIRTTIMNTPLSPGPPAGAGVNEDSSDTMMSTGVSSSVSTVREGGVGGVLSESEEDKEQNSNPSSSIDVVSSDSEQSIVGTIPIFHPLPSMFSSVPRPLSFPLVNGVKELPTLALFSNCNLESKVVSDYADSQQELSLMLALPGLSTRQAPLLSLQQAGDILQAINNPLAVLKVGRMTRKLVPNPALLRPTDDVGTLALWLSPTSDVRLFWHSFLKGPSSDSVREIEEQIAQLRYVGEGSPYRELFSHVELSEELAWVAAESDQLDGGTGIRLEMIDHDPSGRSFKLTRKKSHDRHKMDLASKLASEEEDHQTEEHHQRSEDDQLTDENQKLRQLLATCMSEDSEEEETFFFWIAETSLSEGMEMLNAIQNRLDHLPTLAGVSGVPEKKLQELFDWFSKAQEAASHSTDSTLSHELASWIDLRSGASVPSQLFSNNCPANVPNWSSSVGEETRTTSEDVTVSTNDDQQTEGEHPQIVENTIREGCALSATANFLVADKKWGLTHLATASVMVAVGVESTGFFYDEEKAHKDASHCAHELAKKRAEAGASAEAERLGRIRLEELVAVKSHKEMKSSTNRSRNSNSVTTNESVRSMDGAPSSSTHQFSHQPPNSRSPGVGGGPTIWTTATKQPVRRGRGGVSGNAIKHQIFSVQQHYVNLEPVSSVPYFQGQSVQGNSYLHNSSVHEYPNMATHMPDYLRQHVHYGLPVDQGVYQSWRYYHGEAGPTQVIGQAPQYEHPYWSIPRVESYPPTAPVQTPPEPHQWSYNNSASSSVPVPRVLYQPQYDPVAPPAFYPRHLPPHLPFMQMSQLHGTRRHNPPNMSLVRIAQEAREKVTRVPRDRVRPAPSGSNLAASNIHLYQDQSAESYAWHNQAHQLNSLYSNQLNVACKQETTETNNSQESRACAETPKRATADDGDCM
eukprot:g6444.t1